MTKITQFLNYLNETITNDELLMALMLAYIDSKEKGSIRHTDLVQNAKFGTAPTVHRKIDNLICKGYIKKFKVESDSRSKVFTTTEIGKKWLRSLGGNLI